MFQHWAIFLIKNILADLNDVIWVNSQYKRVKRRVMQFAQRNAVGYYWLTRW